MVLFAVVHLDSLDVLDRSVCARVSEANKRALFGLRGRRRHFYRLYRLDNGTIVILRFVDAASRSATSASAQPGAVASIPANCWAFLLLS